MERALGRLTLRSPTSDFSFQANPSGKHVVRFKPAQGETGRDPVAFSVSWTITNYVHRYALVDADPEQVTMTRGSGSGTHAYRESMPGFLEQGDAVINYGDGPRMAYFGVNPLWVGNFSVTSQLNDEEPSSGIASVSLQGYMLRWQAPMEFVNFLRTGEEGLLIGPAIAIYTGYTVPSLEKSDIYTLDQFKEGVAISKSLTTEDYESSVSYGFRITDITSYATVDEIPEGMLVGFAPMARENWDPTLVTGNKWEDWYA